MSDSEETPEEKPFCVEIAKQGRAACKKCKQKCLSGEVRLAKLAYNPFGGGKMKQWHHVDCLLDQFIKQRPTTKRIESTDEIDGWDDLDEENQKLLSKKLEECEKAIAEKYGAKATAKKSPVKSPKKQKESPKLKPKSDFKEDVKNPKMDDKKQDGNEVVHKDMLFREFRRLIMEISNVSSYTEKTAIVKKVFTKGSDGTGFKGDIKLWCRLLLPGVVKRIYNLQSKQLIKLFSKIFDVDQDSMLEHLEQGDVGETIEHFFNESSKFKPAKKSLLAVVEVDTFLEELSQLTKEDEQIKHFTSFASKCTANDLKYIIRLIKHDLRMNAGAKHVLDGVHADAYEAYQSCRDIDTVIDRCIGGTSKHSGSKSVKATIALMKPVLPMLAEACKSVEQAMKKCSNGMYSEIKYDGERVQVHKEGSEFKYFSRSLKPVLPHKVAHFKDYIPKAFPHGKDLILDSEILMIDTNTGKPLPFGTLGVHKKSAFKDASVCLFVFDCIYYNGEILTNKPIKYRKQILSDVMTEIPNHIVFSEMQEIHKPDDLRSMIAKVLKLGLEGLVLKDLQSIYEPGKRHWLKVKKDYLFDGAMADSADLIVLGAWYGTGKKGGMMSVFLMGCYDPQKKRFCTVTKVHTGHDDKTLERLQEELDMIKISCDSSKVPDWLRCNKSMVPDFVAKDPKRQPVWEITGAEFTKHDVHTADGISIRFPRVTKIRDDKDWDHATNLQELAELYRKSKESTDVSLLMGGLKKTDSCDSMETDTTENKKDELSTSTSTPKRRARNKVDDNESSTSTSSSKSRQLTNDVSGNSRKKNKTRDEEIKLDDSTDDDTDEINGDMDGDNGSTNSASPTKRNKRTHQSGNSNKKCKTHDDKTEAGESTDGDKDEENDDMDSENSDFSKKIINPIPDYFNNVYLLLEEGARERYAKWIRYFIAYGGIIVDDEDWALATHVLHLNDEDDQNIVSPNSARHIIIEWIKDSIAKRALQDFRPYTVRLRPLDDDDTSWYL